MGAVTMLRAVAVAVALCSTATVTTAAATTGTQLVAGSTTVTWDNTKPRLDLSGKIVDSHDGNVIGPINGLYYSYGVEYGLYSEVGHVRSNGGGCASHCSDCSSSCSSACPARAPGDAPCPGQPDPAKCNTAAGFRQDHNVSVWSSPTMASGSWQLVTQEGLPISSRPRAVYYRPKVQFNRRTKLYVLWVNYAQPGYGAPGQYLTATAATPAGPFSIVRTAIVMDSWKVREAVTHGLLDAQLFKTLCGCHIREITGTLTTLWTMTQIALPTWFVSGIALFRCVLHGVSIACMCTGGLTRRHYLQTRSTAGLAAQRITAVPP